MTTLKAAGYSTAEYVGTGLGDDNEEQVEEEDGSDIEKERDEEGDQSIGRAACGEGELIPSEDSFLPSDEGLPYDDMHPLLIFYDYEATGGSIYNDNIIEVATKVIGVPHTVNIACRDFSSLSNTSRRIIKAVQDKCGITVQMLDGQPSFPAVLEMFLQWISNVVEEIHITITLCWWLTMGSLSIFPFCWQSCIEEMSYLIVCTA